MEPLLDLPIDQFFGALDELGLDPERRSDLLREYRRRNSAFSPVYGLLDSVANEDAAAGMQRADIVPISRPEGMSVFEAIRSGDWRLAVPQGALDAVGNVAGALDVPAAAAAGLIPREDMVGEALNAAGTVMGLGGLLGRAPADSLGMFVGQYARNADLVALSRARRMAEAGEDRNDIWNETGWFQGPDGMWRFEIDDSEMRFTDRALDAISQGNDYGANFRGVFEHPALMDAYGDVMPFGGDVDLRFSRNDRSGAYYPDNDAIRLSAGNLDDFRSLALHEMTHGVQSREGFALGGDPDMILSPQNYDMLVAARSQQLINRGFSPQDAEQAALMDFSPFGQYLRLAGESEARNVPARGLLTPQERAGTPPWWTVDRPFSEQILLYSDDYTTMQDPLAGMLQSGFVSQ